MRQNYITCLEETQAELTDLQLIGTDVRFYQLDAVALLANQISEERKRCEVSQQVFSRECETSEQAFNKHHCEGAKNLNL